MPGHKSRAMLLIAGLVLLSVTGCADWIIIETIPALPTLTPSPADTNTPALAEITLTPPTFTPTLTITLSPRWTPTPPLGATSTPSEAERTATSAGPAAAVTPEILYFVATPTEVEPDEPVLLFWSATGGSSAAITRRSMSGDRQGSWEVALEGSLTVFPRVVGGQEQYQLTVTNGIVTAERWVTVTVGCPFAWFFEPAPEDGCPDGDPVVTQAVVQQFERGKMLWLAATDEIIVLFNAPYDGGEAWMMMPDPYVDGEPEDDPNIEPPEGFRQPRRGFGVVWRTVPGVRDRLGWAVGEEGEFTATIQRETVGAGAQHYFSDETGAVIKLAAGGTGWQVVAYVE